MLPSVQQFKINANWMRGKLYFMQEKAGVLDELQKSVHTENVRGRSA